MAASRVLMALMLVVCAARCSSAQSAQPPEQVLYNGKIVTLDSRGTIAEAVALRDGKFSAVGTSEQIRNLAGPQTERVDLEGKTVVPGLVDNHFHGIGGGPGVDLSQTRSLDELLAVIADRARETEPGTVILSNSNWHEGQLREQRLPYRRDLDQAAPDHPVVVVRGGHEYILNSAALRKWGIDESTPEPPGGSMGRDAEGNLNGELVDRAKDPVKLPPRPSPGLEERIESLEKEHLKLAEAALTGIRYAGDSLDFYQVLQEMQQRGKLSLRVNVLIRLGSTIAASPSNLDEVLSGWPEPSGVAAADPWLKVVGVKLGVDGGFEGGWMREPYAEPWGKNGSYRGLQTFPTDDYVDLVGELNRRGWRVATHAVGDAAIDLVLDAYEAAHQEKSIAERRWSIEHGFIPQPDQFSRMKDLGLVVTAQNHLYLAAPSLVTYWGPERSAWVTPVKAYLAAGIPVSIGTDSPVVPYPPFWTIYHFITRDTITAGVMGAEQGISREEALRLSTLGNAYLTFEEEQKGSIEAGKLADLVVLSKDILTCFEKEIETMKVLMTMVGGKVVYRDSRF